MNESWSRLSQLTTMEIIYWLLLLTPVFISFLCLGLSARETRRRARLLRIIDRFGAVRQATNDFMVVAVSYLASPLRVMEEAAQHVISLSPNSTDSIIDLQDTLKTFARIVQQASADNEASAARADVHSSVITGQPSNPLASRTVWLTLFGSSIGLIMLEWSNPKTWIFGSAVTFIILIIGVAGLVASRQYLARSVSSRKLTERQAALTVHLFNIRREFISDQATQYRQLSVRLQHGTQPLKGVPQARGLFKGISWLEAICNRIERAHEGSNLTVDSPLLSLNTFLERAIKNEYATMATANHIKIESDISSGLAFRISPGDFSQLMSSVVDNAVTFSKPGGKVEILGRRRSNKIILEVIDHGAGIDDSKMETLFKPVAPDKDSAQAPALSLHINKIIMARVGGELKVASEPNDGTKVTVTAHKTRTRENFEVPTHIIGNSGAIG